ncbi:MULTISPECIES: D-2-hydroxyacid dehydrogenase [Dickeya]|uniref:D-3-phosphoglycerate dehydrogenase n=1 Tax=Dickeya aquatica TaxID=1401087 RepID=A0A375AFT0_9GAMM|nr:MULTISPECIES: D-2-hydroxyacid dehydrogenase [Dickeya]SLM64731.1 D-3-phosphoglycerate dehydrogenase [Dickeya aquatica]
MTSILLLDSRADELQAILNRTPLALPLVIGNGDVRQAAQCDIWVGEPDKAAGLLAQGVKPRWLQSTWAGYKPLLATTLPRDYRLSRAVGVFGQAIAEYVLAYLLHHELHLSARWRSQQDGEWNKTLPGSLAGRQVLIVGAGEIGREVAGFLRPFGVVLHGIAHTPREIAPFERVDGLGALTAAVADADYVINILPDTPATTDIYHAEVFAAMKRSALFINVGRGSAVVDADLCLALQRGDIAAAVLDVFRQEPLAACHPFWHTPNLTLTAHVAGPLVPARLVRLLLDNVPRYLAGQALEGEVDFSSPY